MAEKERLDIILVTKGLAPSRDMAKAIIMSGEVYVNGQKAEKSGEKINTESEIEVRTQKLKFVSRGGLKLEKALVENSISLVGKTCLDIGASTGGFTDCMLQNGATSVFAVDVGYGQLDWKIRNDERVKVLEKTNARYLTSDIIPVKCDFASVDVSFISLTKIFPVFAEETGILSGDAEAVCLIKPQFECGRKYVGKKGVVKDKFVHEYVIDKVVESAIGSGLYVKSVLFSPIKGPNGNIEYLAYFTKEFSENTLNIKEIVENAHCSFESGELSLI